LQTFLNGHTHNKHLQTVEKNATILSDFNLSLENTKLNEYNQNLISNDDAVKNEMSSNDNENNSSNNDNMQQVVDTINLKMMNKKSSSSIARSTQLDAIVEDSSEENVDEFDEPIQATRLCIEHELVNDLNILHSRLYDLRIPSASGGLAGTGGSKPGLSDKIRKIISGGGGGAFGSRTSGSGGGFGVAGSSGSGGNAWVRAGKKFLPHAVNFGKRYYQRRKYSKGMYAGMGAGAGYYAGSRMNNHNNHNNHYYPQDNYGYPPVVDTPPDQINGKAPTVFYCIQENLNATLVNQTLNAEGFGVCNISGELIECPLEIECKTDESDTCCEDEQGAPFCCGGAIPEEYSTQYGGYADDMYDAAESINKILNIITTIALLLTTICFTMWHQQGQ
ncbi:unnamed protein product, partial [Adineta steineri]